MKKRPVKQNLPHGPGPSKRIMFICISIIVLFVLSYKFFRAYNKSSDEDQSIADAPQTITDSYILNGKSLTANYCQSCHMLPDPSLLDKASWEIVLPRMAYKMGIKSHKGVSYRFSDRGVNSEENKLIPTHPAMNETDWQNIMDYFQTAAPNVLPPQNRSAIINTLSSFEVNTSPDFMFRKNLMISYVKIDDSVKPSRLFVFEAYKQQLFLLDNKLKVLDSINIDGIVVDMSFGNSEILVVTMGNKLNMSDIEKIGKVFPLTINRSGKMQVKPPVFNNLAIPVQIIPADLNGDNRTDYLVCEFGFLTGSLTWMENQGNGQYKRHVIRDFPGSVNAYIKDTGTNGKPDIWVLFAQGEEGIFHFTNLGNGKWKEEQVLRFPPVYGSTSFQMVDINHDGFEDIIYTCGDNGDFSRILKPYHGVYIYLNDGKNHFTQKYFYPINGCYKVIAKDFLQTGRIDLAVIAFFTDAAQPEESFVYLKNEGDLKFTPMALSENSRLERVLTMDSGDIDGDGKTDLLLGNTFPFPGQPGYGKQEPFFLVLKNLTGQIQ